MYPGLFDRNNEKNLNDKFSIYLSFTKPDFPILKIINIFCNNAGTLQKADPYKCRFRKDTHTKKVEIGRSENALPKIAFHFQHFFSPCTMEGLGKRTLSPITTTMAAAMPNPAKQYCNKSSRKAAKLRHN